MLKPKLVLPPWTKSAGGEVRWRSWVESQITRCRARAKKWVRKRGRIASDLGRASEWREAIIQALHDCGGSGRYSHLPLSLAAPGKNTDWNWPSLDHVEAPSVLVEGGHLELIFWVEDEQRRLPHAWLARAGGFYSALDAKLVKDGIIASRPKHAGKANFLRDEPKLWNKLGLLKHRSPGKYFHAGQGLAFDWRKIISVMEAMP